MKNCDSINKENPWRKKKKNVHGRDKKQVSINSPHTISAFSPEASNSLLLLLHLRGRPERSRGGRKGRTKRKRK